MVVRSWVIFLLVLFCFFGVFDASVGDADPYYISCVSECESSGCVGETCFANCKFSSDGSSIEGPWYMQEPLYLRWKQFDCQSNCRYHCMLERENDREARGLEPVRYHGKWPFQRLFGFQEPASVALSALNLAMHFHGWLSFFVLLHYKLPLNAEKRPYYDFTALFHVYAFLALNSWFWSVIFHSRDVDFTETLDYASASALLGYSLILSILRSLNVRTEAGRVMVAAPILAFVTTHILYLINFRKDYGWNMTVCVIIGAVQLLIWAIWAGVTNHPSRWKMWLVVLGGAFAVLLEIFDFPPYQGIMDAHALWHATTIPLTYLWWSFIKDDAEFQTSKLLKKIK